MSKTSFDDTQTDDIVGTRICVCAQYKMIIFATTSDQMSSVR